MNVVGNKCKFCGGWNWVKNIPVGSTYLCCKCGCKNEVHKDKEEYVDE